MKKMLRRFWPGLLIGLILFAAFVLVPVWSSADFADCENHQGQYSTHQPTDNKPPGVGAVNPKTNWVLGSCLSGFINQNGNGITAIATAFLTLITGLLAWATVLQMVNGRRQIRAYVFPEGLSLFDGTTVTPPNPQKAGIPGIVMVIKNSGQTPAKGLISFAKIDVIEPRHESTLVPEPLQRIFSLSLGASGTFPKLSEFVRALNAQEIADIATGTRKIYVFGRIEYFDIFGEWHFTNFRFSYSGAYPPPPGSSFLTTEHGNDFE